MKYRGELAWNTKRASLLSTSSRDALIWFVALPSTACTATVPIVLPGPLQWPIEGLLLHVILVNNLLYKQLAFQASAAISVTTFAIDVDYTRARVGAQLVGEWGIAPSHPPPGKPMGHK